jgi:hypothetical protein
MKPSDFLKRADELLVKGEQVRKTIQTDAHNIYKWVDSGQMDGFRAACLSFLANTFGERHSYYVQFVERVKSSDLDDLNSATALIRESREEVAGGWTASLKGLVAAEIFADLAEMASYLLEEGYHTPAAVLGGCVLEEHLRQLAQARGIAVTVSVGGVDAPKKADRLNGDLATAGVYNKLDQKSVTAWLGLRNSAAHGKVSEYTPEQVGLMHQGVLDFMVRNQP